MLNLSNANNANASETKDLTKNVDLEAPGVAKAVSVRILEDIDHYCETEYDDGHRSHLGASLIGHDCSRYLWYVFRWCYHEKFNGRMQRLFNRGHREEERFVEWLRGIGCEVHEVDPNTGKQFRITGVMGHFGGSLDGIAKLPPRYQISKPVLLEFKTIGSGQGFTDMTKRGMMLSKPQHYAQTSLYGLKYDLDFVLYNMILKSNDDLHTEVVKLNHKDAAHLEAKAERIIMSQKAPPRLSDNPTYHKCQYCPMMGLCHKGETPEKNCRSCKFAVPIENAQWGCNAHNQIIPPDFLRKGCDKWQPITE